MRRPLVPDEIARMLFPDPDPEDYGATTYEPEVPQLESELDVAGGFGDFALPLLGRAASRYEIPRGLSKSADFAASVLRGLLSATGARREGQVAMKLRDMRARNASEVARVGRVNTERGAEASSNRTALRQAKTQVQVGRRTLLKGRAEPKEPVTPEGKAAAQVVYEKELDRGRRREGLHRPGSTPTPKPKPPRFNPASWRLLSDADNEALGELKKAEDAYAQALKEIRANPRLTKALKPPLRDRRGRPLPEPEEIAAARATLNELRGGAQAVPASRAQVYRDAAIAQLSLLPEDPKGAEYVWGQIDRTARRFGFADDPEFKEALDAAAEAIGGD